MTFDHLAFVDIETTGGSTDRDRILEIAVICVDNDHVTKEFTTLVNPQMPFSPFIEMITGIKPSDVEGAPTFEDIQHEIYELLKDRIFIAHNVGFDYGFIKHEFKRLGLSFSSDRCCTVKLSRHLYPEYKKHNLDSLIERFEFSCENRHRAYSDTSVLWQFYQHIWKTFPEEHVLTALKEITGRPKLPPHIAEHQIAHLPEKPGVYIFYGEQKLPLYIGKSKNIKDRIFSHFGAIQESTREMEMYNQIREIEFIETPGELGALLLEASLIKDMSPIYNKRTRKYEELVGIFQVEKDGYFHTEIKPFNNKFNKDEPVLAIYKTKAQAKKFLERIVDDNFLCRVMTGLEKSKTGCFNQKIGRCPGACIGEEDASIFNERFLAAFERTKLKDWPYAGAIMIEEVDVEKRRGERYIFKNWQHIGTIKWDEESSSFSGENSSFDYDIYLILKSQLQEKPRLKEVSENELQSFQTNYL
jgi:DNA polymerase-3 subunit epsilon